jgi:RNA polymerase primary sigma factor
MRKEIDFIPHPDFPDAGDREDGNVAATLQAAQKSAKAPADLPAHLRRLCEADLLTHEQERALFREMNLLKYRAYSLRSALNPEKAGLQDIEAIETLIARSQVIRDHIVKANMRLVISIVKKFVTPQQTFDDMLSEGTFTLMQAVDKFDFDRGFRFSTYAYRSIARSAYRSIAAARQEAARFARDAEEWAPEQEEARSSSSMSDHVWSNLRELTASLLDRLDRRERFIIRSRYALGAHRKVRTCQYLADRLGISKERVRQLEQRAVAKLRGMVDECEVDERFWAAIF